MQSKQKILMVWGVAAAFAVSAAACTTPGKKTAIGAGAGAATGAAVGAITGGKKGALIGAGAGVLTGAAIGNYLDKRTKELSKVAEAHKTADGVLVKLKNDLLFDTGKSDVKPQAQQQLTELGKILAQYPGDEITIVGHTDDTGSNQTNQKLSEDRANAVKSVLTDQGVAGDQLATAGAGEGSPVAPNTSAAGRAKNRRVELKIVVPEAREKQAAQEKQSEKQEQPTT